MKQNIVNLASGPAGHTSVQRWSTVYITPALQHDPGLH